MIVAPQFSSRCPRAARAFRRVVAVAGAVALGFPLSLSGAYAFDQKAPTPAQCEVAQAYLETFIDQKTAGSVGFASTPPESARKFYTVEVLATGWSPEPPAEELVKAFYSAPPGSALECPGARSVIRNKGYALASRSEDSSAAPEFVNQISIPTLNSRGDQALIYSTRAGKFSGSSELRLLERSQSGRWRTVSVRLLSIS